MRIGVLLMACLWFWINCSIRDEIMGDTLVFENTLLLIGVNWDVFGDDDWTGDKVCLGILLLDVVKLLSICVSVVLLVIGLR